MAHFGEHISCWVVVGKGWGSFQGRGVPGGRHLHQLAWEGSSRVCAGLAACSTRPPAPPTFCESRFDTASFAQPFLLHLVSLGMWKDRLGCCVSSWELLQQYSTEIPPGLGQRGGQASPDCGPSPPFFASMDGFRVVKLSEVIRQVDVVITCTGRDGGGHG